MSTRTRIIQLVLCVVVVAPLVGCGSASSDSDKVRLRWVTDPNPARQVQLAKFHAAHPDIEVYVDPAAGGMTKVLIQFAAHAGPDLVDVYTNEQTRHYARYNVFLDITDRCRRDGIDIDMFWPQCRHWMTYQDRIVGLPTNCGTFVLFYNKDHFDEAGLDYPDDDWTWDDLRHAAQQLTVRETGQRRYGYQPGYNDHFLWQAGGDFFSEDGLRCTLDTPEALRAFQFLYDLRHTWSVAPTKADLESLAQGEWGGGSIGLFAAGRVSMIDMGRWAVITFRRRQEALQRRGDPPLRYGIAHLPRDAQRATTFLSRATCINAETAHPEEAFAFLKFLATEEYNRLIAEGGDGFPAVRALAQSDMFLHNPDFPQEDQNHIYLESVEYARAPLLSTHVRPAEFEQLREHFYDFLNTGERGRTVEDKLLELTQKVNQAMDRYREEQAQ